VNRRQEKIGKILSMAGLLLYAGLLLTLFKPQRLAFSERREEIPASLQERIIQFTEGFQYKESEEGKVVFSLSAGRVLGYAKNTFNLQDVSIRFYSDRAVLDLACRTMDFDANTRDFGIQGNITLTTEDGLTLWTEEMAYRHRSRFLMGLQNVQFSYGEEYWGWMTRPVVDVRRSLLTVDEGFSMNGSQGDVFLSDGFQVNLKSKTFTFPEGAVAVIGNIVGTFDSLEIREIEEENVLFGECGHLTMLTSDAPQTDMTAPVIRARFQKNGQMPIAVNLLEGGEWTRGKDYAHSEGMVLRYREGRPDTLELVEPFEFDYADSFLSALSGTARLTPRGDVEEFTAFGNIILCTENTLVHSEYLLARPLENTFTFREMVDLRNGALYAQGGKMVYNRDREQVQIHERVHVMEDTSDLHVTSDHAMMMIEQKTSTFTGTVHAWTPEYDLRCETLFNQNRFVEAKEKVVLLRFGEGQERLSCDFLQMDQERGRMNANGNIHMEQENMEAVSEYLTGRGENGAWNEVTLTGGVVLKDLAQGIEAEGDRVDFIEGGTETVFIEGCPARVIDSQGKMVSASTMVLDRSTGQMYLIGEGRSTKLEVKGEPVTQTLN